MQLVQLRRDRSTFGFAGIICENQQLEAFISFASAMLIVGSSVQLFSVQFRTDVDVSAGRQLGDHGILPGPVCSGSHPPSYITESQTSHVAQCSLFLAGNTACCFAQVALLWEFNYLLERFQRDAKFMEPLDLCLGRPLDSCLALR